MSNEHKHRKGKQPDTYAAARKRVRRADCRRRCHERCECVRDATASAARGCFSGSTVMIVAVLLAAVVALAAITGKL